MSLAQDAFIALYDSLNEHDKKPAIYKLLEELPLDEILKNAVTIKKIKALVAPHIPCEIFKELFMRSNNFAWILDCYLNPKYFKDMLRHVKCTEWKYLIQFESGGQIAIKELSEVQDFLGFGVKYESMPFDVKKANPNLLKNWHAGGMHLIDWHCF